LVKINTALRQAKARTQVALDTTMAAAIGMVSRAEA
jgi:hypothetical protein